MRDSYEVNHTDSCGGVIFRTIDGRSHVLLIRGGYGWSFPKGHREPGETEHETAVREIFEETGISVRLYKEFRMSVDSARHGEERKIVFFLGEYAGGSLLAQQKEVFDAKWMTVEDAKSVMEYMPDRGVLLGAEAFYQGLLANKEEMINSHSE